MIATQIVRGFRRGSAELGQFASETLFGRGYFLLGMIAFWRVRKSGAEPVELDEPRTGRQGDLEIVTNQSWIAGGFGPGRGASLNDRLELVKPSDELLWSALPRRTGQGGKGEERQQGQILRHQAVMGSVGSAGSTETVAACCIDNSMS